MMKFNVCLLVLAALLAPLCLSSAGAEEASGAESLFSASGGNSDPFRYQGTLLDPIIRKQLERMIKISKMKEVLFKDYPRRDNWDVEILPPHNVEALGVVPDETEAKHGFILFTRPITDLVFPYSKPQTRVEAVSMVASPGEYEPFTLGVYNLGEARPFTASLSPFKHGETGALLPGDVSQIRTTEYLPLIRKEQNLYINLPMALEARDTREIGSSETGQFWITTYVPAGAASGTYTATLSVSAANGATSEIPVSLYVLPFETDEPSANLSMCFLIQNYKEMFPENLDLYMGDMKTHGLNTSWMWPMGEISVTNGKVEVDFAKRFSATFLGLNYFAHSVQEMMEAYAKAGFDREWIYGSYDGLISVLAEKGLVSVEDPASALPYLKDYTEQLLKFAKEHKLPPFELLLIDEPGFHPERLPSVKKLYEGMHQAFPGQPLMLDCGPWAGEDKLLAPYLKDIYYTEPSVARKEFCDKEGIGFGNYNSGSGGRNPMIDRYTYGVWAVRAGLAAVSNWAYTWRFEPQAPDGNRYVFPSADGPIPSPAWEAVREGIDDHRYLVTFQRLADEVVKSADAGKRARAEAMRTEVDSFLAEIPQDRSARRAFLETLSQDRLDLFRRTLISHILELGGHPPLPVGPGTASGNALEGTQEFSEEENAGLEKVIAGLGPSESFRYSLDLRFTQIPAEGAFFGGMGRDWFARLSPDGTVEFGFLNEMPLVLKSSVRLVPSKWYHVALSVDRNIATITVDGALVASKDILQRQWDLSKPLRLSGFAWEPAAQKGYFGHHGFFIGELRNVSISDA